MSDFTVFRNKNFASIPTYHLRNHSLSLKAVGLLTKVLLLPPEWDYSLSGLATLNKDGIDSVRSTLNELKYHNYIEIEKLHSEKGTWKYNYIVFEKPADKAIYLQNKPDREKPGLVKPDVVKPSNYISNNNILNNNNDKYDKYNGLEDFEIFNGEKIRHNQLTELLISFDYVEQDDYKSLTSYDNLFLNYLDDNHSVRELTKMITYIVPRVVDRDFLDEDNNEIKNRIGYLKSSLEQNWRKFESMDEEKELWRDEDINETLQFHNDGHIWLHGGDIACMDKDGVFFYKQRLKRMIISSGYNVYPSQIEEVIEQHPAVLSCSVVGIPHKYKIEVAKAFIVLKEGYSASLELK